MNKQNHFFCNSFFHRNLKQSFQSGHTGAQRQVLAASSRDPVSRQCKVCVCGVALTFVIHSYHNWFIGGNIASGPDTVLSARHGGEWHAVLWWSQWNG